MGSLVSPAMKLTLLLLSLLSLSLGTVLASPGLPRADNPSFDDHCTACMQPTTVQPSEPSTEAPTTTTTTTEAPLTTNTEAQTTTTEAPTTTTSPEAPTTTTTPEAPPTTTTPEAPTDPPTTEQSCEQLFTEGCVCDTDAAPHHIVSLAILAAASLTTWILQ